jgi:hypothetical protein
MEPETHYLMIVYDVWHLLSLRPSVAASPPDVSGNVIAITGQGNFETQGTVQARGS